MLIFDDNMMTFYRGGVEFGHPLPGLLLRFEVVVALPPAQFYFIDSLCDSHGPISPAHGNVVYSALLLHLRVLHKLLTSFYQFLKFLSTSFQENLEVELVLSREESFERKSPFFTGKVLFNKLSRINEVLAHLEILRALMLSHFQQKLVVPHLEVVGDVEVEFANRDGHFNVRIFVCGEVGLDGVPVLVKFVVAWVQGGVPLWTEKRQVVPWAGSSVSLPTRVRKRGTIWKQQEFLDEGPMSRISSSIVLCYLGGYGLLL